MLPPQLLHTNAGLTCNTVPLRNDWRQGFILKHLKGSGNRLRKWKVCNWWCFLISWKSKLTLFSTRLVWLKTSQTTTLLKHADSWHGVCPLTFQSIKSFVSWFLRLDKRNDTYFFLFETKVQEIEWGIFPGTRLAWQGPCAYFDICFSMFTSVQMSHLWPEMCLPSAGAMKCFSKLPAPLPAHQGKKTQVSDVTGRAWHL